MSFMPNPGSIIRVKVRSLFEPVTKIGIVTKVTPNGKGDLWWDGRQERRIHVNDIIEIIHEPESEFDFVELLERDRDLTLRSGFKWEEMIDQALCALERVQKSRVWFEPYSDCLGPIVRAMEALTTLAGYDAVADEGGDPMRVRKPLT